MSGTQGYIGKSSPQEPRNRNPRSFLGRNNDVQGAPWIFPYMKADDSGWAGDPNEAPSITDPGLIDAHPGRMVLGMQATVVDYPSAGTDTTFKLEKLPLASDHPFSLDEADNNYWGNFWAEDESHQKRTSRVYQYAPSTPSGGSPPFPYTTTAGVAFESNWKSTNQSQDGNKWVRFRTSDEKILADDGITEIYADWTVPIPLGDSFETGDYVENRFKRQNINEANLVGGVDSLTTGKSYQVVAQVVYAGVTYEEGRIFIAGVTTSFTGTVHEVVPVPPETINGAKNNNPTGWFDTPAETGTLASNGTLWKIYAQKNIYGQLKSAWVGPTRINEDPSYIRYSKSASPHPDNVVSNQVSGDGSTTWVPINTTAADGTPYDTELTARGWKQSDDGEMAFIATRQDDNGGSAGPPFTSWRVERVANESGEYVDRAFKLFDFNLDYDNASLQAPTNADATTQDWSDVPLAETDLQINYVSESRKFYDGTLKTPWSNPVPYTSKEVFNDIIDSLHDSFKKDTNDAIVPASITLSFKLFKGITKIWEQPGIAMTFVWKKVYDNGTDVDVSPTDSSGDDFYKLATSGTAGTSGYFFDDQRVVIKPGAVTGKAVFRCTATLSMAQGDDIVFEEEFEVLDISDGKDAKDLTVKADNQRVIYDTSGTVFNPTEVKLRVYTSNLGSPTFYWYEWNGASWAAISAGGGYTISGNVLTIDIATATLFAADGTAEEQRFAVSTHATDPDAADFTDTFSDFVTIVKLGSAGIGAPGENAIIGILDNEAETLVLDSTTGEPQAGEIGSSGRVKTTLQLYDGTTKQVYGGGNDYTIAVAPTTGDVQFAFQSNGNDVDIYVLQWNNPGTPVRGAQCTITITYGAITRTKIFSVSSTIDAPGAIILDIDSDKGFSFTPSDQTDKTLTASLYDTNQATQLQDPTNYHWRWKIGNGAFSSWSNAAGANTATITRATILSNDNVTVESSSDSGSTVLRARTVKVNDVVDGRTFRLFYNYSLATYNGLTEPFAPPAKPTGDYTSKNDTGDNQWTKNPQQDYVFWASDGQYNLAGTLVWSNAYRIKGEAGGAGQQGDFFFPMFKQNGTTLPNGDQSTKAQMTGAGWTATVPPAGPVYRTERLWTGNGVTFDGNGIPSTDPVANSKWTTPVKISGDDGGDGDPAPELQIQWSANGSTGWSTTPNTFVRVSTDGGDTWSSAFRWKGDNGSNAPAVVIQYSANGSTGWSGTPNDYIRFSTDGGSTFGSAYKIVGDDGLTTGIKRFWYDKTTGNTQLSTSFQRSVYVNTGNSVTKTFLVKVSAKVYNDDNDFPNIGLYTTNSFPISVIPSGSMTEITVYPQRGGNATSGAPFQVHQTSIITTNNSYIAAYLSAGAGGSGVALRSVETILEIYELD